MDDAISQLRKANPSHNEKPLYMDWDDCSFLS